MKKLEDETKAKANRHYILEQANRQQGTAKIGRLLLLYVDDDIADTTPFGIVRHRAFTIMPKDSLQITGQRLSKKPITKMFFSDFFGYYFTCS